MVPSYNVSYSYAAMIIVGALLAIVLIEYSRTKLVNSRFKCFLIACLAMFGLNVATAFTNALHESIPYAVNMALNGHSFRVGAYSRGNAKQLGLSKQEQERIYLAGLIHDIGKIGVPETILTKPGKLTPEEYKIIQSHSALSGDILSHVEELTSLKDSPSLGK